MGFLTQSDSNLTRVILESDSSQNFDSIGLIEKPMHCLSNILAYKLQELYILSIPLRLYFNPIYLKGAAALLQSVWPPAPTAATIPPTTYVHRSGTWLTCDEIIMNGRYFIKQSCFNNHYCEKHIARRKYYMETIHPIWIIHNDWTYAAESFTLCTSFHLLFVATCVCTD